MSNSLIYIQRGNYIYNNLFTNLISERTFKHLQSKSGKTLFSSFKLDIEEQYLFKISAFSMDSYDNLKSPAYEVYISQWIRYSRACGSYQDFLDRGLLLTRNLLNQGFLLAKLKSSFRKFYGRHHDLVNRYRISVSKMTTDMFLLS
jgi:hypothetical protein